MPADPEGLPRITSVRELLVVALIHNQDIATIQDIGRVLDSAQLGISVPGIYLLLQRLRDCRLAVRNEGYVRPGLRRRQTAYTLTPAGEQALEDTRRALALSGLVGHG